MLAQAAEDERPDAYRAVQTHDATLVTSTQPLPYLERHAMDKLLTADEVAELLKVKTEWVWAQARAGRIPHVRLGRYRRFRESAIEAWLLDHEIGGAPSPSNLSVRPVPLRRRA